MEIDVGKKIAGKYELVRLIGKGAMGEVWLATHESLGGEFAVKLVKTSEDMEDETAAGRFQLEAQVSAKLSRKTRHIVSVSDHGEEDGLAYLVMEVLEGESLDARLGRQTLELPELVGIVTQIGRALSIAHSEGIFHRDLKPANIFLSRDEDDRLLVKLLDFGIARSAKPVRTRSPFATGKDMVLGTPSYMSPEQARGLDSLDYRCDLWALAVVAYEALTRDIPWAGDTVEDIFLSICTHRQVPIRTRRADLPFEIDAIFEHAFAPRLEHRFAHATEIVAAFEGLVAPEAVDAAIGTKTPLPSARRLETPRTPQEMVAPRPSADHLAVAVNDDTQFTIKRGSSGWLYATIGGVATVGIIVALLLMFGRVSSRGGNPPAPTTTTPVASVTDVPPPDPKPLVTAEPKIDPPPQVKTGAIVKPPTPVVPSTPATPTTAVVAPPPPVTTPTHVTPPPPVPTKKHDRGEVF